jgi:hypothetical protein
MMSLYNILLVIVCLRWGQMKSRDCEKMVIKIKDNFAPGLQSKYSPMIHYGNGFAIQISSIPNIQF